MIRVKLPQMSQYHHSSHGCHLNVRNVRCLWNMFTNSECHINERQNQQITALSTLKIKFTITFYIFKWKLLSRLPFGSLLLLIFCSLQFYISAISFFFVKIFNNDGKGLQSIHANSWQLKYWMWQFTLSIQHQSSATQWSQPANIHTRQCSSLKRCS